MAYLDPQFNFIRVNRAYVQASGHTHEELIGCNHFALFPNAENQAIFQKVRDSGEPVTFQAKPFEFPDQPARGITYWDWSLNPIKDSGGAVRGLMLSLLDVTERQRAAESLRVNEERFRFVLANSPVILATLDLQLRYTWVYNPAFGFRPEDVVGKSVGLSVDKDARRKIIAALRPVLRDGASAHWEMVSPTATGSRVFESFAEPLKDANGLVTGVALLSVDITERKEAEKAVESAARFPAENPNPVLRIARDGMLLYANDASHAHLTGWSLAVGQPAPAGLRQAVSAALHEQSGSTIELEHNHRIYSFFVVPIVRAHYANIYGRDITARKQAEREREELLQRERAARADAEAAVQVRDNFIALASHELKTPLTSLKGYAELLLHRSAGLDSRDAHMVSVILRQTARLETMISGLLDITRIERGQLSLVRGPVDLGELINSIVIDLQETLRIHTLALALPAKQVVVSGDKGRLEQVLLNLIENGIRYSPMGGPVSIRLTSTEAAAEIEVSDQGIGIPAGAQEHIFSRFYRAENAERYHINGLGLGLYVAREIIHLHGGEIVVASVEGQGSTFTVRLPAQKG